MATQYYGVEFVCENADRSPDHFPCEHFPVLECASDPQFALEYAGELQVILEMWQKGAPAPNRFKGFDLKRLRVVVVIKPPPEA